MKQFYYLLSIALCALFLSNTAWAQVDVKGQVNDDGGDPLAGVNILIKRYKFWKRYQFRRYVQYYST